MLSPKYFSDIWSLEFKHKFVKQPHIQTKLQTCIRLVDAEGLGFVMCE